MSIYYKKIKMKIKRYTFVPSISISTTLWTMLSSTPCTLLFAFKCLSFAFLTCFIPPSASWKLSVQSAIFYCLPSLIEKKSKQDFALYMSLSTRCRIPSWDQAARCLTGPMLHIWFNGCRYYCTANYFFHKQLPTKWIWPAQPGFDSPTTRSSYVPTLMSCSSEAL